MKKPERILVNGLSRDESKGGVESYVINLYRHCDRRKLQFDFVNSSNDKLAYAEEIQEFGGHIFKIPRIRDGAAAHYQGLHCVYSSQHYAGAYYASGLKLKNLDFFKYAQKYNVPVRALHSHSSAEMHVSVLDQLREKYVELRMDNYINTYFACSKEAGKWMFGSRPYTVLSNGIDTRKFMYQPDTRCEMRKRYNLDKKLVLGTVGRLTEEKNPFYTLQIFSELKKINPNVAFLHIGDGSLRDQLEKRASELNIEKDYRFVGQTDKVADYLNAMDVFLLPSKYEGFPIVLVEAQSTGLSCFVANNITHDCRLTDKLYFLDINRKPADWAWKINQVNPDNRKDQTSVITNAGYDIRQTAQEFQDYFLSAVSLLK